MNKIKFTFIALSVICSTLLFSCVTEEVISTEDMPGGRNERAMRIDSAQQVRTVESPQQMLFTKPDSTKRKVGKQ